LFNHLYIYAVVDLHRTHVFYFYFVFCFEILTTNVWNGSDRFDIFFTVCGFHFAI